MHFSLATRSLLRRASIRPQGPPARTAAMFGTLNISLMGDPGNNNGAITATTSGVSFANTGATGVADDITLGFGTLVSAMLSFNPATGVRSAHFVENFQPATTQAAFFV